MAELDVAPDKPRGKIDLVKAIQLRSKGTTYQDIANIMGCSKQAVQERISRFMADLGDSEELEAFKELEVKFQDAVRLKYGRHLLDPETVKKASARDAAIVYGTIYDKQRLERGLSTQNTAVIMASAVLEAEEQEAKRMQTVTETATEAKVVDAEAL